MHEELVKAIFAAGFRLGKRAGEDEATSYHYGNRKHEQTAEQSWNEDIKWHIETDGSYHLDINSAESWDNL